MSDDELRCRHCKQLVSLTAGPEYQKARAKPAHYYHRGYAVEFRHTTVYVCEPCLIASTRVALRRSAA